MAGAGVDLVALEDIRDARRRIADVVVRTPTFPSSGLGEMLGFPVWVKAENLQKTGSFKIRGALNAMRALTEAEPDIRGFTTLSAGNHGTAVAFAARTMNRPAVVCMPPTAVAEKVASVRRYGGEVVLTSTLLDTCVTLSLQAGKPMALPGHSRTVADGLAAPFAGAVTYHHIEKLVDEVVVVPERDIVDAIWPSLEHLGLLVEPSAVVPIAAILCGAYQPPRGRPVALIASGGNVSREVIRTG